ncbi:flagellar filament capping protein FliD, partial [Campylobacter coli]|uniref:flagellar filament capping protein FliD n=1 Tax=Campylobacter coli TaxID=195 RepID=UPI002E2EFC17
SPAVLLYTRTLPFKRIKNFNAFSPSKNKILFFSNFLILPIPFTDLGVGLTLTLNKTGEINFDVQQDNEAVTKTMQELVDAYNN